MASSQQTTAPDPVMQGVTELSRRLRILEERYTVLRRKGQLTGENVVQAEQDVHEELDVIESEVVELRRMLIELDAKMDRFLEQAKKAAPREEVLILRKYIEMWDPVQYVTREEAKRLLNQRNH